MVDSVSRNERSRIMALIKSKNTKPEKLLRSLLHHQGLRFQLHKKELPGKPDIIFPKYQAVIFINGCFWHGHPDSSCKLARIPKSNEGFWRSKIEGNRSRDNANKKKLTDLGWRVLTVWECSLHACHLDPMPLIEEIIAWLNGTSTSGETIKGGRIHCNTWRRQRYEYADGFSWRVVEGWQK